MRSTLFGLAMAMIAALTPALACGGEKDEEQATQYIATMLRDSGRVQHYKIGVKYSNGTVWLTGQVTSKEQMAAALDVVSNLQGVRRVINNLSLPQVKNARPQAQSQNKARLRQPGNMTASGTATSRSAKASPPRQNSGVELTGAMMAAPRQRLVRRMDNGIPQGYTPLPDETDGGDDTGVATSNVSTGRPLPAYTPGVGGGPAPAAYDQPHMPNHAWPSYAAYPNYAAVTYPKQYSPTAWPFIGPFYPYPQVPMGWRKVSLEWDDGWWMLDFEDRGCQ